MLAMLFLMQSPMQIQVCSALGQIAKHSVDLAEVVVEADIFPKCLTCLRFPDEFVQKNAATLVRAYVCFWGRGKGVNLAMHT